MVGSVSWSSMAAIRGVRGSDARRETYWGPGNRLSEGSQADCGQGGTDLCLFSSGSESAVLD
jgi:hypothetical protein